MARDRIVVVHPPLGEEAVAASGSKAASQRVLADPDAVAAKGLDRGFLLSSEVDLERLKL